MSHGIMGCLFSDFYYNFFFFFNLSLIAEKKSCIFFWDGSSTTHIKTNAFNVSLHFNADLGNQLICVPFTSFC